MKNRYPRVASVAASLCFAWAGYGSTVYGAKPLPSAIELDDRPEPFVPRKAETEADQYKRQALSYYGAGMMYEQQGNREEALKHYQRALRFDPDSTAVLGQIVEVAWSLERHQEAIRYALKAAEVGPANPELLERLAAFLAEDEKLEQATELYEKAATLNQGKEKTVGFVRLKLMIGQLYARQKKFEKASDAFALVLQALQKPEDYGIRGRTKTQLEGEKGRTYLLIGETFLRAERIEPATAAFEKAFKVAADPALESYYHARLAEKNKRNDEALAKLEAYFTAEADEAGVEAYELYDRLLKATGKS
ncbi:MAG: tetratricopeptide repeat protein [Planctomycetia bacterium]|nr:tetratricopeptide repeat protein [Planctomycetia bacterium]